MGLFHLLCIQRRALAALVRVTQSTNAAALGISAAKSKHLGVWDFCTPNIPSTIFHYLHTSGAKHPQAATIVGCAGISQKHGFSGEYFPRQ